MAYKLVHPDSKLDWEHDWTSWLGVGDSIVSRQWSIEPLNGTSPQTPMLTNSTSAGVTAEGCLDGKVYDLSEAITTAAGIEHTQIITLRCSRR